MRERTLLAGELGSRYGAAAVLVSDPANLRWLGRQGERGEVLLLSSGVARALSDHELEDLGSALGELGIGHGAMLACDAAVDVAPPGYPCLDLSGDLAAARMRKSEEELSLIGRAAALAGVGQEALRVAIAPGVSEAELWGVAREAMAAQAGDEVTALCDLLGGARSAEIDGEPGPNCPAPGEPVLFDLAPTHGGYWADSCATRSVGAPSPSLRRRHDSVRAALELGIRSARPGVAAGELAATIGARLEADGLSCPHHFGHGVGVAAQEPPFLIPGETTVLEEGMTIAIEPGAYSGGLGVRLEHLVLIEADGAGPLTTHSLDLT